MARLNHTPTLKYRDIQGISLRQSSQSNVTTRRDHASWNPWARDRYCRPAASSASHRDTYMGTSTVHMKVTYANPSTRAAARNGRGAARHRDHRGRKPAIRSEAERAQIDSSMALPA